MKRGLGWTRKGSAKSRLLASFLLSVVLFLAWYLVAFVLLAPSRVLYNFTADPGQFLFFTTILYGFFGVPLWAILFLILTIVGKKKN